MDRNRFDGFTRQLAHRENRRQAIKTLLAGGFGTAAAVVVGGEAEAAKTDCCPATAPTLCDLTCTDTLYGAQNCGGCGITCGVDERCYKGVCESTSIEHCTTVADCSGGNTECSTRTCKKGVCGWNYAASGKKTATQVAGDCQRNVCDGAGNVITIVDNTDKPPASSLCTTGICVSGVPHQNQKPVGAKCPTGKCNAAGICSGGGCLTAAECPAATSECQTATCLSGICGYEFVADGTETAQQTQGDCKKDVCDGNGNIVSINDDGDIPAPMDPGACFYGICSNGTGQVVNQPAGTACAGGVCDGNGNCGSVPNCFSDIDCTPSSNECVTMVCQGGSCVEQYVSHGTPTSSQTSGDCQQNVCDGNGGTTSIADDNDAPPPYYDSCYEPVCSGGNLTQQSKAAGASCDFGICDGNGACVGCLSPADCAGGVANATTTCDGGYCGYTCNEGWGDCQPGPDGCETNLLIDDNNCGLCGRACPDDRPCVNGACAECVSATDCPGTDSECQYRTCTAGVCGIENAASGIATSEQTTGDCRANVCDGNGGITSIVDDTDIGTAASQCVSAQCNAGVLSQVPLMPGTPCSGGVCDGQGGCVGCVSGFDCPTRPGAIAICQGGSCTYACAPGFQDCNGLPQDGCETNLMTDSDNCGLCGRMCAPGQSCSGGACV